MKNKFKKNNLTSKKIRLFIDKISLVDCMQHIYALCDEVEKENFDGVICIEVTTNEDNWIPSQLLEMSKLYPKWEKCIGRFEKLKNVKVVTCPSGLTPLALELLMVADYRIVGTKIKLQLASTQLGIIPTTTLYRASKLFGIQLTKKLFLFGQTVEAHEGLSFGLFDEVSANTEDSAELMINSLTPEILENFSVRRRLISDSQTLSFNDALGSHLAACDRLFALNPAKVLEINSVN